MHVVSLLLVFLPSLTAGTRVFKARNAHATPAPEEDKSTTTPSLSLTGSAPFNFSSVIATTTLSLVSSSHTVIPVSTVHNVNVSDDSFSPAILHCAVGDLINFYFHGPHTNYSVAESSFFKPCKPKRGGVDQHAIFSGFVPVADGNSKDAVKFAPDDNDVIANRKFTMQVNSTDPIWLYCPSSTDNDNQEGGSLCKAKGMSMVVNPGDGVGFENQTLAAYQEAVKVASGNVSAWPDQLFGGNLVEVLKNDPYVMSNGTKLNGTMYANGTVGLHQTGAADITLKLRNARDTLAVMAVAAVAGLFAVGL